jgi:hypothetical protein
MGGEEKFVHANEDMISRTPYGLLFFGGFCFFLAAAATLSGRAWARFHGWVSRTEQPKQFWETVGGFYLLGLFCIGYYFYLVA